MITFAGIILLYHQKFFHVLAIFCFIGIILASTNSAPIHYFYISPYEVISIFIGFRKVFNIKSLSVPLCIFGVFYGAMCMFINVRSIGRLVQSSEISQEARLHL